MYEPAVLALVAISNIKIHTTFHSIAPTAPITAAEMDASHAFMQIWSALWRIPRSFFCEEDINSQSHTDDVLVTTEDEDVR